MLITFLNLLLTITLVLGEDTEIISVQMNVGQTANIIVPFPYLIKATVNPDISKKYLEFSPNKFRLNQLIKSQQLPRGNQTLLQQLRTPFSEQYSHIFKIGRSFFIFKGPNHFSVAREGRSNLKIFKQFTISEIKDKNLKFHCIDSQVLVIFLSDNQIIILNQVDYKILPNPFNTTDIMFSQKISQINTTYCLAFHKNKIYTIDLANGSLILLNTTIVKQNLDVKAIYISIERVIFQDKVCLWIIQGTIGLLWVKVSLDLKIVDQPMPLVPFKNCFKGDLFREQGKVRIVITCQQKDQSTFVFASFLTGLNNPLLQYYLNPHIEDCKTNQFKIFKGQIISLQRQSFDIFLPTLYKDAKQAVYTKNEISLARHICYWIQQDFKRQNLFLYSVSNNTIIKSQLVLQDYYLQIKSQEQIQTKFDLTLEYLCPSKDDSKKIIVCEYKAIVQVNSHNKSLSFQQTRSINLGLILLLITSVAAIASICIIKYRAVQNKALQNLKLITNPSNIKI